MAELRNTLRDAVRKLALNTSVDQLKKSGVKKVNVLGIDRIVSLIDEAVNRSLRHHLIASERAEVIDATKEEFLKLLKSNKDLERSREELAREKDQAAAEADVLRRELQSLSSKLEERLERAEAEQRARYEGEDQEIGQAISVLFDELGDDQPDMRRQVEALVRGLVNREREAARREIESARSREFDNMQRRIRKLQHSLDVTEKKLTEVSKMKDVEHGIASLYREVQGLSSDAGGYEKKKGLMDDIFKANLALQRGAKA